MFFPCMSLNTIYMTSKKNCMFLFLDAVPRRRELFSKRLSTHPLMCDRYICRCYVCMHWDNVKLQREHHRLYIKDGCHPQVMWSPIYKSQAKKLWLSPSRYLQIRHDEWRSIWLRNWGTLQLSIIREDCLKPALLYHPVWLSWRPEFIKLN